MLCASRHKCSRSIDEKTHIFCRAFSKNYQEAHYCTHKSKQQQKWSTVRINKSFTLPENLLLHIHFRFVFSEKSNLVQNYQNCHRLQTLMGTSKRLQNRCSDMLTCYDSWSVDLHTCSRLANKSLTCPSLISKCKTQEHAGTHRYQLATNQIKYLYTSKNLLICVTHLCIVAKLYEKAEINLLRSAP